MPQQTLNFSERNKNKERPPSRTNATSPQPTTLPTLEQLKATIADSPGIIKNASEARDFLVKRQWILQEQKITIPQMAAVLLNMTATSGSRRTTEKIPESVNNIIKAVAYLLEEATIAEYVDKISNKLTGINTANCTTQHDTETTAKIDETLNSIKGTIDKHSEAIQKASKVLTEIQETQRGLAEDQKKHQTYREALINGHPQPIQATTIHEAKIQNRLNISDCQIMIEIQSDKDDIIKDTFPAESNPYGKIKATLNQWLANTDEENPAPRHSNIRAITQYRKNKILIETGSRETAVWIKQNGTQFIQKLLGHPIKILGRLYPVVARFMPVLFSTNEEGVRDLEGSANLPANTISHVTWIKNPDSRKQGQTYANVKIFCKTPETANQLIIEAGRFKHLGSNLRIHKDIKAPSPCNRCQRYGHISADCPETRSTCGKCAEEHRTHECQSSNSKCTPCGSTEHQTNDMHCPQRITRERAILAKNPEALSPYYSDSKNWFTFGKFFLARPIVAQGTKLNP